MQRGLANEYVYIDLHAFFKATKSGPYAITHLTGKTWGELVERAKADYDEAHISRVILPA